MKKKFCLFLIFNLIFNINIFSADIEVSSTNNQTQVEKTANGIDSVNIANPNSQGISYNDFDKFNVNEKGAIINNSLDVRRSQLGGIIEKNPNLTNNAKTVISEVTGKNLSQINGYIEMFGGKADFILANPNGIIVNGGGFINIPNATLTTGRYDSVNNNFIVENGEIVINAPGIDAKNTDYFAIISRAAKIYGDIFGGVEVKLAVGQNEYNPATKEIKALENPKNSEVVIDSTELGGIYAGKIAIVSTEKGVGVNSNSEMVAGAGDFTIDANGNVVLNSVQATGRIVAKTESLKVDDAQAYGNIELTSNGSTIVNNLASNKDISIQATDIINSGSIIGNSVNVNSASLSNGIIYGSKDVNIESGIVIQDKDGYIVSENDLNINSTNISNEGILLASNNLQINNTNLLTNNGTIEAKNQDIYSTDTVNNGIIYSYDSINIKSDSIQNNSLVYGEQVNLDASINQSLNGDIQGNNIGLKGTLLNNNGSIKASNKIAIENDAMENSGLISASNIDIKTGLLTNNGLIASDTTKISGESLNNESKGQIKSNTSIKMNGTYVKNNGEFLSTEIILTTPNDFTNNGVITGINSVDISANNFTNNEGKFIIGKDIKITSKGTVSNSGEVNGNTSIDSQGSFINTAKGSITGENLIFVTPQMINEGSILSYTFSYKDGTIKNSGNITTNDFVEKIDSIINSGFLTSYGKLEADRVENTKQIIGKDILINKEYKHNSASKLLSLENIRITSENGTFVITGEIKANGFITINSKNSVNNSNAIRGFNGVTINTENFINTNIVESAKNVNINANDVKNDKNAIIYAGEELNLIGTGTLENRGSLESAGNLNIGNENKKFNNVKNISGSIQGNGIINIYTNNLENIVSPEILDAKVIDYEGNANISGLDSGKVNVIRLGISQINNLNSEQNQELQNKYANLANEIIAKYGNDYTIVIVGYLYEKDGGNWEASEKNISNNLYRLKGNGSKILSGSNINIYSATTNNVGSSISAIGNINITGNLQNSQQDFSISLNEKKMRIRSGEEGVDHNFVGIDDNKYTPTGVYRIISNDNFQYERTHSKKEWTGPWYHPEYKWVTKETGFVNYSVEQSVNTLTSIDNLSSNISAGKNVILNGGSFTNNKAPEVVKLEGLSDKIKLNASSSQITLKELEGYKVNTEIVDPNISNSIKVNNEIQIKETQTPSFQYMYENRLEFVDLSKYYGSEYFFQKIGYSPEKDAPVVLVGDAYVETKIITKKIEELIGNHYIIDGVYSDIDQIAYMYENAAKEKSSLNLSVGVKLTPEQVAKLTSDIIWLEEQEINGVKVLVPQVYIRKLTIDNIALMGNSIVAGKNIVAKFDDFQNSGYIQGGETVQIKSKNVANTDGGIIVGNNIQLLADNNIDIQAAVLSARNKVILNAGNNVNIISKAETEEKFGTTYTRTVTNYGSSIDGNDISISAGNNANIIGSNLEAENNINIGAKNDVNILAVKDSVYNYTQTNEESGGILKKSKTITTETYDEQIVNSNIAAKNNIVINAGHDVNVVGSTITNTEKEFNATSETGETKTEKLVDGSIEINAVNNVKVAEAREVHVENVEVKESGFKLSFDKNNFILKAGVEQTTTTTNTLNDLAKTSELSGGNIAAAGKNIILQGVNVNANSNVDFSAEENVSILEAKDLSKTETKTETTFTGLTLTFNQDLVHIDDNIKLMLNLPKALTGNMSSILNGSFGAIDGLRGTADAINAVPDVSANGQSAKGNDATSDKMSTDKQAVKDLVSASFGTTRTTETSGQISETSVASNINAQNIKISSKKDTTVQGSNLNATKDITIEADNLNILASAAKTTSYSNSKTESLSVGVGVDNENNANLGGVTGSLSKNNNDSESIKNTNSTLNAGGNLKIATANDLTIKGGVVKADTVDLTIGNNLTIESLQDTERSKNSSFSASLTVSTSSANGSLNMQNGYVDNAWVNEQSGITAANGGSIKVANNTDLKGAIIASENKDKAIELDTKTFTYEDIKDKQEGKTTGFGISGGITSDVPATSVQYASNDKRQDTNATLSNVNLTVNGEKVDPNTTGINTDITQAQVITKDERVDMIDVNLQTDLANKEERDKIRDAKDKIETVAVTVKNIVDSNNVGGIKENYIDNRFTTNGANAIEDNEELNKLQKELKTLGQEGGITEEEAKMIVLATVKEMYEANGFSDIPDIKFENGISGKDESVGARGTETGTIYIDLNKLASEMNKPDAGTGTLVGLIAHETSHSEKYGETTGNFLIEEGFADSKENLAENTFKEDKEVLTPEERAKALADLKEKYAKEKADSDSVTANSKDESVEGNKYYKAVEEAKEFYANKYIETNNPVYYGLGMLATLGDEDTWPTTAATLTGGLIASQYYYGAALTGSELTKQVSDYSPTPVGKKGIPMEILTKNKSTSILDRVYSGHALDRMQGRGIPPSAVENAIKYGVKTAGNKSDTIVYIFENVKVVTNNRGDVVTVIGQ